MNISDVGRLNVDECHHFERADVVVCSLNVVEAMLVAVEAGCIDRSMAGAFLGASAEKRTPSLDRDAYEGVAEGGKLFV